MVFHFLFPIKFEVITEVTYHPNLHSAMHAVSRQTYELIIGNRGTPSPVQEWSGLYTQADYDRHTKRSPPGSTDSSARDSARDSASSMTDSQESIGSRSSSDTHIESMSVHQFQAEARRVHGETYYYGDVQYLDQHAPICIGCRLHGSFFQTPLSHVRTNGCRICNVVSYDKDRMVFLRKDPVAYQRPATPSPQRVWRRLPAGRSHS
jgi:hypothetical protein